MRRHEIPSEFSDDMTLGEARDLLRTMVDDGAACPCCTQFAKVYKRKIHARMARDLIMFTRRGGHDWQHAQEILGASAPDFVKLHHWGLIEPQIGVREDGSKRVGIWRVTDRGLDFVYYGGRVPARAHLYDGRLLRLEGNMVTIRDCLGDRFDYAELMAV